ASNPSLGNARQSPAAVDRRALGEMRDQLLVGGSALLWRRDEHSTCRGTIPDEQFSVVEEVDGPASGDIPQDGPFMIAINYLRRPQVLRTIGRDNGGRPELCVVPRSSQH